MCEYKVMRNIVFGKTDRESLTANIYLPQGLTDIPCVILVHGGGWKFGTSDDYSEWANALAGMGYFAMCINYRRSTPWYTGYPGGVDDVEAALNYVVGKAHEWNLDPYNLGFFGDSSGAHLSFMCSFRHEYTCLKIRFIVAAYGVYDLPAWLEYADRRWPYQPNVIRSLIGKDYETEREYYELASPYYQIDKIMELNPLYAPDIFLAWGADDGFVPSAEQSIPFAEKLRKYERIHLETLELPDVAHIWFVRDITNGYVNPLDKYPLNIAAPKILAFVQRSFAKPRFKETTYTDSSDYKEFATYRTSRLKPLPPYDPNFRKASPAK